MDGRERLVRVFVRRNGLPRTAVAGAVIDGSLEVRSPAQG
jgi:hypothetical protein